MTASDFMDLSRVRPRGERQIRLTSEDILRAHYKSNGKSISTDTSRRTLASGQVGLLHRTLIHSPSTRWVFNARIRHSRLNDLIFVGENFVQIKAIVDSGEGVRLISVASKFDFSSRIRAANIVGTPFAPVEGLPSNYDRSNGSLEDEEFPPNMLVLSLADGDAVFLVAKVSAVNDPVKFSSSSVPLSQMPVTGQPGASITVDNTAKIIAFTAHDGFVELLKLKCWEDISREFSNNRNNWGPVSSIRPLYSEPLNGTVLHLTFLNTEDRLPNISLLAMVAKIRERPQLLCWQGDLFEGQTTLEPFIKESPLGDVQSEDYKFGCACPDLIIPYANAPGFVLACGSTLHFFNIVSGNVVSDSLETHPDMGSKLEPQQPAMYQKFPSFTAFCHCFRSIVYKQKQKESFYLLREDGVLLSVEVDPSQGRSGMAFRLAAKLQCYGSEALVAFLTTGTLADPDRMAIIGDMSDGRVLSIGEKVSFKRREAMEPHMLQRLPNWSPILDVAMVPTNYQSSGSLKSHSLFITSSRQPHGVIAQLCAGFTAIVGVTVPVPELEDTGTATGLWVAYDERSGGFYHFVSFVDYSLILTGSIHELSMADMHCRTLAVAHAEGLILHVSPNKITLFTVEGLEMDPVTSVAEINYSSTGVILAAAPVPSSIAAIVARQDDNGAISIALQCGLASGEAGKEYSIRTIGRHLSKLTQTPTAISVFECHRKYYALIGTSAGSIIVSTIDAADGISEIGQYTWDGNASTLQGSAIESIGILGDEKSPEFVILCGLREGSLRNLNITLSASDEVKFSPKISIAINLGQYSVSIQTDPSLIHNVAFATCGSRVVRISKAARGSRLEFKNVWFQDENEDRPGFKQPQNAVLSIVPTMEKRSQAPMEIAVFSDQGLILAVLDPQSEPLQFKKIPLSLRFDHLDVKVEEEQSNVFIESGTPQKLLYLSAHDILVVAAKRIETVPPTQSSSDSDWAGRRAWMVSLILMPLSAAQRDEELSWKPFYVDPRDYTVLDLGQFEQVTCMCEWEWRKNSKHGSTRKQLLVATSIKEVDSSGGRLYFIDINRDSTGHVACVIAKVKSFRRPIKSMVALSTTRLVVCDAEGLDVYGLAKDDDGLYKKWKSFAHRHLQDSCRLVTANASHIYVTGTSKSFTAFRYNEGQRFPDGSHVCELVQVFGDGMARSGFSHLLLEVPSKAYGASDSTHTEISTHPRSMNHKLVLLASENNSVTIISHPANDDMKRSAFMTSQTLITTSLPYLVTRLVLAPLRPPWLTDIANPAGVIGPDIIGSSPAGAITHFRILDTRASHLLKFLQNLVSYDNMGCEARRINASTSNDQSRVSFIAPVIDPLRHVPAYYLDEFHKSNGAPPADADNPALQQMSIDPSTFAIDGDMLDMYVQENGAEKLLSMLTQETWEITLSGEESEVAEAAERNGNTQKRRILRFISIVRIVLGDPADSEQDGDDDSSDLKNYDEMEFDDDDAPSEELRSVVLRCVRWLKDIWQFL